MLSFYEVRALLRLGLQQLEVIPGSIKGMAAAKKDVSKRKSKELASDGIELATPRNDAPNPVWFKPVMFGFMLLGLIWIVLYYVTSSTLGLPIPALENGNIFVGFGLVLVGFLMTPWWK